MTTTPNIYTSVIFNSGDSLDLNTVVGTTKPSEITVFGNATGAETVTLIDDVATVARMGGGNDVFTFKGNKADYTMTATGTEVVIKKGSATVLTLKDANAGDVLKFADDTTGVTLSATSSAINAETLSDTTAPTIKTAEVNGTSLTLTFSEAISSTLPTGDGGFAVSVGSATNTVTAVTAGSDSTKLVLTLTTAVTSSDTSITVSYTAPITNPIKDANKVALVNTSSAITVDNLLQAETKSVTQIFGADRHVGGSDDVITTPFTSTHVVTVKDTATNLQALTVKDILALKALNVDFIDSSNTATGATDDNTLELSASQAEQLAGMLTTGDTITLKAVDTLALTSLTGIDKLVIDNSKTPQTLSLTASDLKSFSSIDGTGTSNAITVSLTDSLTAGDNLSSITIGTTNFAKGKFNLGTAPNSAVTLTSGDDVITADSTGSTINGGAGNDSITGGAGNDSIIGGAGNDIIVASGGTDTIDGGDGTDTLDYGTLGSNLTKTLTANVTNIEVITYTGGTNNVSITTDDANVASGATFTLAHTGTGTLTFDGSAETDGKFSITGGSGADTITGGRGNDTIDGGAGDDTITLVINNGNGTTTAIAEADSIVGGAGTDTLVLTGTITTGATVADNVINLSSTTDQVQKINSLTGNVQKQFTGFEHVDLSGLTPQTGVGFTITANSAGSNIIATSSDDSITGGSGADTITGGTGNDTIVASAGTDVIDGGDGTDTYELGTISTDTTVSGTLSNLEELTYTSTSNKLTLTTTDSLVSAGATFTLVASGTGGLVFDGSAEADGAFSITGGTGNDSITGGSTGVANTIDGGAGDDTITLTITDGDGTSTAIAEADSIDGGTGNDTLVLTGNITTDVVGKNVINLSSTDQVQQINNLTANVQNQFTGFEHVDLSGLDVTTNGSGGFTITANSAGSNIIATSSNDGITGGSGADTITGGAGVDVVDAGAGADTIVAVIGETETITGGADTDTVQFALTANASVTSKLVDVEIVELSGAFTGTIDASKVVDSSGTPLNFILNSADSVVVNKLKTNAQVLTLTGIANGKTATVDSDTAATGQTKVTLDNGTASSATSIAGLTTAGQTKELILTSEADGSTITTLTTNAITDTITLTLTGNLTINSLVAGNTTKTTVTSSGAGTLKLDASASTNKVDITGSAQNDTIIGGSNDDTITGGAGNDSITGGSGADTITGGTGADVINLGVTDTATDIVYYTAGDSSIASYDQIANFEITATGDKLDLANTATVQANATATASATIKDTDGTLAAKYVISNGIMTFFKNDGTTADTTQTYSKKLAIVQEVVTVAHATVAFVDNGNTFVYQEEGTSDLLVQLTGVTTATALATTAAATTILVA